MNWEVFSTIGYVSVALLLCVPLLWLLHLLIRPRRWLAHVAVGVALFAAIFASVNSKLHVSRIQVDMSEQIAEQQNRREMARKAAEAGRAEDVAQKRFAEDASGDFLDVAGLDDADREFFDSFDSDEAPEWKKEKKQRTEGGNETDDLEAMIGASEQRGGVGEGDETFEEAGPDPIMMSDADKTLADRLDKYNLNTTFWVFWFAVFFMVFDYVRRLNVYREAYLPLPVPSAWADALAKRDVYSERSKPRRSLHDELRHIARRGEVFLYVTDDVDAAVLAMRPMPRLPLGVWPIEVLDVKADEKLDDDFVFESLWFGHNSFVVDTPDRVEPLFSRLIDLLAERRATRAHTRQAVHVVWDRSEPMRADLLERLKTLGSETGFTFMLCPKAVGKKAKR